MIVLLVLAQAVMAFLLSTVLFDVLHFGLHVCLRSSNKLLKKIGNWHSIHHRFFPATLEINYKWAQQNLIKHALLEYLTQVTGTLICLAFLHPAAIVIALFFETGLFLAVCYWRGADLHHKSYTTLPSHRGGIFVGRAYHALHHVYANRFYSSYIKFLDYLFGTGLQLKRKHIVLTGASGALGSNMKILLEKEGAIVTTVKYKTDYTYDDYSKLKNILAQADILFLCHGSKYLDAQQANCDSFIAMIELFKSVRKRELLPLEIWGVGSEIECHPCFGFKKLKVYAASKRNYAKAAHNYFHDKNIQYRHIVHAAFTSSMGPGLMSAKFAAFLTLFFLKRGFKYVPVTYTGIAFINYFKFVFFPRNNTIEKG